MSYLRDHVIILKAEPFREQDTWVTMYGRAHGKLVAVARGARRMSAKSLGHLQPFSEVDVMIAKGAAFDKLAVARLTRPCLEMRSHLGLAVVAGSVADAVERLSRPASADEEVYHLLREVMDLPRIFKEEFQALRGQALFAACSLKLLDRLGYGVPLDGCVQCRGAIDRPWTASETPGFYCSSCIRVGRGEIHGPFPERTLSLLKFMRQVPIAETLRITAPRELLSAALHAAEHAFTHTALSAVPHGGATVAAYLSA